MNRITRALSYTVFTGILVINSLAAVIPETNALTFSAKVPPAFPSTYGQFGRLVSLQSNVVVFGNWVEPTSTTNILATVYRREGDALILEDALPAPALTNLAVYDLATDGNRIAFAAAEDNVPALYIFARQENHWILENTLHPTPPLWSIAMNSGVIVAGAAGKALVYELTNNVWNETTINAPTNVRGAFGVDVAIDHDTILVGSPGDPRNYAGGAFAYIRTNGGWEFQAELPSEDFIFSRVGGQVAISGDIALLSAYPDRFNSGFVYVFLRSGGAWSRAAYLTGDGGGDFFGQSLAASGRNLVVGGPSARGGGGVVFLFRDNGTSFDKFRLFIEDFGSGSAGDAGSFLGWAVAAAGDTIIAGAPYHDADGLNAGGGAIFRLDFPPTIHSPFLSHSDNSFHFVVIDAKAGSTYLVETAPTPDATNWTTLKEFQAVSQEVQVQVDLSGESSAQYFRLREKAPSSE